MPLGAPIGSGLAFRTPPTAHHARADHRIPLIVDAGVAPPPMHFGYGTWLRRRSHEHRYRGGPGLEKMAVGMKLAWSQAAWHSFRADARKLYASASSRLREWSGPSRFAAKDRGPAWLASACYAHIFYGCLAVLGRTLRRCDVEELTGQTGPSIRGADDCFGRLCVCE